MHSFYFSAMVHFYLPAYQWKITLAEELVFEGKGFYVTAKEKRIIKKLIPEDAVEHTASDYTVTVGKGRGLKLIFFYSCF